MGSRLLDLCEIDRLDLVTAPRLSPPEPIAPRPTGTRGQLIAAAEDLLATRLESAVTGRELAAHAGVNYGLVNHHFGSKTAVFDEALVNLHQRFLDDVLDAAARSEGIGAPDVFFRHRAFMRAWAGRLLADRPVPEFKLLGMQRLIDELAEARGIAPTDRDARLRASGDALASVRLLLGWSLVEPAQFAGSVDRSAEWCSGCRACISGCARRRVDHRNLTDRLTFSDVFAARPMSTATLIAICVIMLIAGLVNRWPASGSACSRCRRSGW